MVTFDKENGTFSITIRGDESNYFEVVKALAGAITCVDQLKGAYSIASLLEDMLPDVGQNLVITEG